MKTRQRSLKVNFLMNVFLTMSSFLFPLVTFPYVSRILLPSGVGKVSFALSVISYFSIFSQLGIPVYGIRACAKVRDDKLLLSKTVHEIFLLGTAVTLITYIAFIAALALIPRLHQEKELLLIVSLSLPLNTLGMEWLYKALEQYVYISLRSVFFKLAALAGIFLLVHSPEDYVIYGGLSVFAASASSLLNFINLRRLISLRPLKGYRFKRHLKAVLVFFAMSCATTVYTNLDTVMLGFMKSDAQVGYYHAAVKVKSILVSIVTSLGAVLLPRASYYTELGLRENFQKLSQKALNFVVLISLPLMAYFILFAQEGILFLSGPAYAKAVLPMQLLMPTLLFIGLTNIMGMQVLVPLGDEKAVLQTVTLGALLNLSLNLILIPAYSCAGAAFATLAAEACVLTAQFLIRKDIFLPLYRKLRPLPAAASTLAAGLMAVPVKKAALTPFFTLLLSAALFFSVYAIFLLLFQEPLAIEIKNLLLRRLKLRKSQ